MIHDRPPKGWKRPSMPARVKLDVVIRQEGKCKQTNERLGTLDNTRFDHRPALWERHFDDMAQDTIPPANDPSYIDAVTIAGHDIRTHGPGGEKRITTLGSDSHRRAKEGRVTAAQESFRDKVSNRLCGAKREKTGNWPASRKLQSRGFEKRPIK